MFCFHYRLAGGWPPLAWIARLTPGKPDVLVTHGPGVETHHEWFGEIVWAGSWERADFDRTDIVFGSGARLRQSGAAPAELVFVPAASMLDRIQSISHGGHVYVSNSLACLLAQVEGAPDPTDHKHFRRLGSNCRGIDLYERYLPTSAGAVRLTYHDNLVWNGHVLIERAKPDSAAGGFGSFEGYRQYLVASTRALAANAREARRGFPFALLGTVSGGYDSPACAVIAREAAGLAEAVTFVRPDGSDGGLDIARRLGISVREFPIDSWLNGRESRLPPEAAFVAADAKGEDVFLRGATAVLRGRVLVTGHPGGAVWNHSPRNVRTNLARADRSGLSATEFRLLAGYIHFPLPYLGARHLPDLVRISQSPQMAKWDIGGWYNRPIPRRILEEAGVARESFGWTKRASSILLFKRRVALSPESARDLNRWLRAHTRAFVQRRKLPPAQFRWLLRGWRCALVGIGCMLSFLRVRLKRGRNARLDRLASYCIGRGEHDPIFDYAFPWAVDRLKRQYAAVRPMVEHASAEAPSTRQRRPLESEAPLLAPLAG